MGERPLSFPSLPFHEKILIPLPFLHEETLSTCLIHCRDFMDADMDRTKVIICYLRPLLRLENPQLERFIHRSASSMLYILS